MRKLVHELASTLPGVSLDGNLGPDWDSWKVGGKLFAIAGDKGVSVKCADPETAAMLIETGLAEPAPYLKRGGWVRVSSAALSEGTLTEADISHRLRVSYDTIVASLPKRLRPATEA